jgi:biopolymer transport protein ExbD
MTDLELEAQVLETLAGGQTRSALELVTDLRVPFAATVDALDHLQEAGLVDIAYQDGDETFFTRTSSTRDVNDSAAAG